jgi:hypothetical protein
MFRSDFETLRVANESHFVMLREEILFRNLFAVQFGLFRLIECEGFFMIVFIH